MPVQSTPVPHQLRVGMSHPKPDVGVAGYCVTVEVALHNRPEPLVDLHNQVVRAVEELLLDFFQLGSPPLARRLALHYKTPLPFLPAHMREAQEIKRVWLSSSLLFPVALGIEAELNPARFVWVQFQAELSEPSLPIHQETVGL